VEAFLESQIAGNSQSTTQESATDSDIDADTQTDTETETSSSTLWTSPQGDNYRMMVLGALRGRRFMIAGVTVLLEDPNNSYKMAWETASALAEALFDAGDVKTVFAQY
jgi:hypothetical protein